MRKKDITTHSQNDISRIPTIWEYAFDTRPFRYKIHRHIYVPGTWFLSCRQIGIDMSNLYTDSISEAEETAKKKIEKTLLDLLGTYEAVLDELMEGEPHED